MHTAAVEISFHGFNHFRSVLNVFCFFFQNKSDMFLTLHIDNTKIYLCEVQVLVFLYILAVIIMLCIVVFVMLNVCVLFKGGPGLLGDMKVSK